MGDISENFSRSEFACKCGCGFDTVDIELIQVLEDIRNHFSNENNTNELTIRSGCRCPEHNRNEKGSSRSRHIWGQAADFLLRCTDDSDVVNYLNAKYLHKYGIGAYNNRTHVDIRRRKARW